MMQRPPLARVDPREGHPQLGHRNRGEGIQHPGNRRLVGKHCPPPRCGKSRIGSEAGVDLLEGGTVRKHTDHDVEQLLVGLVEDGLATKLDMLPQRCEEIMLV
jgi:hypothetical protein